MGLWLARARWTAAAGSAGFGLACSRLATRPIVSGSFEAIKFCFQTLAFRSGLWLAGADEGARRAGRGGRRERHRLARDGAAHAARPGPGPAAHGRQPRGRADDRPGRAIARDTTTVEKYIREESNSTDDTTWTAKYDVSFDEEAAEPTCWLTIKAKLNPGAGVSQDDVTLTKIRARSRFSLLWDSEFILHEHRTVWADRDWLLRPEIKFVDSEQHLTINLHAGRGNDDRQNWYMGSPEYVYAHEISHQMGLLDEYASDYAPSRKVYDDHSIMGDYVKEGLQEAGAKLRHGERLAAHGRRRDRQGPQGPQALS